MLVGQGMIVDEHPDIKELGSLVPQSHTQFCSMVKRTASDEKLVVGLGTRLSKKVFSNFPAQNPALASLAPSCMDVGPMAMSWQAGWLLHHSLRETLPLDMIGCAHSVKSIRIFAHHIRTNFM